MANTALEVLKSSLGFLTTLPVKGDVDLLRRNLWIFPFVGLFLGFLISVPAFFGIGILCLILYVALEGINHIDGLADLGDAFFAPRDKKLKALKDLQTGAGGVAFLCVYFVVLYHSFLHVNVLEIMLSQILAKFSMLILLTTSKPSWEGMGAYFMEFARKRDLIIGSIPLALVLFELIAIVAMILVLSVTYILRSYAHSRFGGVNGDVIGASNCISFASSLFLLSQLN